MIYDINHLTAYSYEAPVTAASLALRLRPRTTLTQRSLSHEVRISPEPDHAASHRDFYGNVVDLVSIDTPHTDLKIRSIARVEVTARPELAGPDLAWQKVAEAALSVRDVSAAGPSHFLFSSPNIALSRDVTRYARECFTPGRGIVEGCTDLMTRIRKDFAYKPQTTQISTSIAEAFAQRAGVCQDFAQIMIGGLRGLGLPAAYVSGYLRTIPPPGKPRLQGADATHAWVSVWAGAENGWIGFDPTNAIRAGTDHITLAIGRDFSDVSPVYGVFVGSGENELKVEVDVIPVDAG
ncbi:transglutaminase family protein [Pseudorhodoplanes sp.]|uniref:transglutaminase family protein n=1 Tax=Pseudorhodoplanes sp. TaxID=1934341 RepID=UPI002CCF2232|nr:transglutaminase family protein [Pseudorhodoplanes sp.]HWV55136.1 transglutaminase family protein [Pseudorhodoplanes sp.]